MGGDDRHIFLDVGIVVGDDHVLTAEDIGRTQQNRVTQFVSDFQRLFGREDGMSGGARDAAAFQQFVKTLSVLRLVDRVGRGAENVCTDLLKVFGQLDGCLTAELDDNAVRLFGFDQVADVFLAERVKVQTVAGIEIGRNGFGVVVGDDRLIAELFQFPYTVNRAVVELDALTDTDGAGAENDNFFPAGVLTGNKLLRFVFIVIGRIEVRRFGLELGGAGINHLVSGIPDSRKLLTGETGDRRIEIAHLLGLHIFFEGQFALFQFLVHLNKVYKLIEEPFVDHCDFMDVFNGEAAL